MSPPRCPTCQAPIDEPTDARPFCSERCKLIDLGSWLKGDYRVPAPYEPYDPYDELPEE